MVQSSVLSYLRLLVMGYMKGLDRETYLEALEEYIDFCNEFIPKRGERMIERIKLLIK